MNTEPNSTSYIFVCVCVNDWPVVSTNSKIYGLKKANIRNWESTKIGSQNQYIIKEFENVIAGLGNETDLISLIS